MAACLAYLRSAGDEDHRERKAMRNKQGFACFQHSSTRSANHQVPALIGQVFVSDELGHTQTSASTSMVFRRVTLWLEVNMIAHSFCDNLLMR